MTGLPPRLRDAYGWIVTATAHRHQPWEISMRKRMGKHFRECSLTFLVLLLFLTRLTVGVEPNSTPAEKGVSKTAQQRLKMKVTYSCVDSPIETVLMALAERGNIDIVKSPKVTGNVTVKVTNVPLEEALTNILAAHDYTYVATESMIRVIPTCCGLERFCIRKGQSSPQQRHQPYNGHGYRK
jgi:hypothetical protein